MSSQVDRLNRVLMQDKSTSPVRLLPALKSDMRDILREYGDLSEDVTLSVQDSDQGYDIILIAKMIRFK